MSKEFKDNKEATYYLEGKWPNFLHIYTDGSKTHEGVGCAFYCPRKHEARKFLLPPLSSIYTAEIIAIKEAIKFGLEKGNKTLILTDSRSTLEQLEHRRWKADNSYIYELVELIMKANKENKCVHLMWVKGHSGIQHNEAVDALAKESIKDGDPLFIQLPYSDFLQVSRKEAHNQWQQQWQVSQKKKGFSYATVQRTIPTKPWFWQKNIPRRYVTSIIRIRLGHTSCPAHLYRIGVTDSPTCSDHPEEDGDLNHIIFGCTKYAPQQKKLWEKLTKMKIPFPTNINLLMSENKPKLYSVLAQYLQDADIKL